jgi:5-methylcytosine-specific restriction endonuclease McrA
MQNRICKDCGVSKSVTAFRTPRGRKCIDCLDAGHKARAKRYYQNNCEDIKARVNQRRLDNLELDRERKKREYQENSEYIKARSQRNRDNNPENIKAMSKRYYEENKEQIISSVSLYYWETVREYSKHLLIARRAKQSTKTKGGGAFTGEEWLALKAKYSHTCLCCGKQEPEITLTPDHIVPVSKYGSSNIDNIQPLCGACNNRKRSKIIDYRIAWEGELWA